MITRDSLVVVFLSPDESEENNIRHVSRVTVVSTYSCLLLFFALVSPALNLLSGSLGGYLRFSRLNERACGNKHAALCSTYTAPHTVHTSSF